MSIFTPNGQQSTFNIGDAISSGIDSLADAFARNKEAEAKIEVTKSLTGSPYLILGAVALVAVALVLVYKS